MARNLRIQTARGSVEVVNGKRSASVFKASFEELVIGAVREELERERREAQRVWPRKSGRSALGFVLEERQQGNLTEFVLYNKAHHDGGTNAPVPYPYMIKTSNLRYPASQGKQVNAWQFLRKRLEKATENAVVEASKVFAERGRVG